MKKVIKENWAKRSRTRLCLCFCIALCGLSACTMECKQTKTSGLLSDQDDFFNLINIKNIPRSAHDRGQFVFSDLGAWSGYALPEKENALYAGAFVGPMLMNGKGWVAASMAVPDIVVDGQTFDLGSHVQTSKYLPGRLAQEFRNDKIAMKTELCFVSSRSAAVRTVVKNVTDIPVKISMQWTGGTFDRKSQSVLIDKGVIYLNPSDSTRLAINFRTADQVRLTASDSLEVSERGDLLLQPGASYQAEYTQSLMMRGEDVENELNGLSRLDMQAGFEQNADRWNNYLSALLKVNSKYLDDAAYRKVVVKALITLNSNWRSVAGDILHAGSYPSYNHFIGFWSWDSWKIASANTLYNPEFAKDEIRSLFDYQAENGMVPDLVGYDKRYNNWRDSKPPLAAWAVMNIYKETGDKEFLEEMFDKLYRYHKWWYAERDHNQNGICEYGSTDGSRVAAAWESGMDNGVRFDDAEMEKNGDKAWSLNQESICLNSFLYAEKNILSEMADVLGNTDVASLLKEEGKKLKLQIQNKMFDKETGFFYDIRLDSGDFIKVMGAECWIPLWAEVATAEQAKSVKEKMMNPAIFNSYLPLGTLDVRHAALSPERGYWRGPVWVDQVYFGIQGLRNYGFEQEADYLLRKFVDNAQGLTSDGAIYENYNPLTGEALNCPNFGWSSALIIKMLLNR